MLLYISAGLYAILLLFAGLGLRKLRNGETPRPISTSGIHFSVIIPFRNEKTNLPALLLDLTQQRYQHFDVVLVNDHSDDGSEDIVQSLIQSYSKVSLISLTTSAGKKAAILAGINHTEGDYIITVDADVRLGPKWLEYVSNGIGSDNDMIILPVAVSANHDDFLSFFQAAENLAIQSLTFGFAALKKPISCNGANLVFRRSSFLAVGGYRGHEHVSSGDDILLMHRFLKAGLKVNPFWNADVIAITQPAPTLVDALRQRVRWSAKAGQMMVSISAVAGLIMLLHTLMLLAAIFTPGVGIEQWLSLLFIKVVLDVVLIKYAEPMYHQRMNTLKLALVAIIYIAYLPLITLFSAVWKPKWKGRRIT